MKIAGLQKLSLVDYPGAPSAVIFTAGCDLRCPYCHNEELIGSAGIESFPEEELFGYLKDRGNMIEAVVITGGEPTLNEDLGGLIERCKNLGYRVKLDTNGTNPQAVKTLTENGRVDFVALDIKTSPEKYYLLSPKKDVPQKVTETLNILISGSTDYELRTTCAPEVVEEEDIHKIAEMVKGAERYALQQFRPGKTLDKSFADRSPYPPEELTRFKSILEQSVKKVVIRGI